MDFTITIYKILLESLKNQGFLFQPFAQFLEQPKEKSVVLRHEMYGIGKLI